MKYAELQEPCKSAIEKGLCLGCVGLAEENWHENKDCIYARVPKAAESIEQIKINLGASNHSEKERETNDYYATDPKALKIFLDKLTKDNIQLHKNIWEPACGEGHLSKLLEEEGYKVISSDLIDRGFGTPNINFLKTDKKWKGDILTNPPYQYAQEFVEHSLDILENGYYCIMFLKIQFLEGKARLEMFRKYPLKYIYVNSARQLCAMNGDFEKYKAMAICYCWYIWEKGFTGNPEIRWI